MGWIDAQGRPEIVMHPDIVRGEATYRIVDEPPTGAAPKHRAPTTATPPAAAIRLRGAIKLVMDLLGRPPGDPGRPWRLVPFPAGWLVEETPPPGAAAPVRIVEAATGRVRRFPPGLTADELRRDYPQLAGRGHLETLTPIGPPNPAGTP